MFDDYVSYLNSIQHMKVQIPPRVLALFQTHYTMLVSNIQCNGLTIQDHSSIYFKV